MVGRWLKAYLLRTVMNATRCHCGVFSRHTYFLTVFSVQVGWEKLSWAISVYFLSNSFRLYSLGQKSNAQKTFVCDIFTQAKYIFQWNFTNLLPVYIHTYFRNFGRLFLIFKNSVNFSREYLLFLPFQVSSLSKSDCLDFIANDEWPQSTRTSIHWIIRFGAMLESYHKVPQKQKAEFKDALQLIWSALPEKATDNAEKDHRKRLQACVSASVVHFEHNNCYS